MDFIIYLLSPQAYVLYSIFVSGEHVLYNSPDAGFFASYIIVPIHFAVSAAAAYYMFHFYLMVYHDYHLSKISTAAQKDAIAAAIAGVKDASASVTELTAEEKAEIVEEKKESELLFKALPTMIVLIPNAAAFTTLIHWWATGGWTITGLIPAVFWGLAHTATVAGILVFFKGQIFIQSLWPKIQQFLPILLMLGLLASKDKDGRAAGGAPKSTFASVAEKAGEAAFEEAMKEGMRKAFADGMKDGSGGGGGGANEGNEILSAAGLAAFKEFAK